MNQDVALKTIAYQGVLDKRMEKIIQTIITDGEKKLDVSDFEYYCTRIPELIKLINSLDPAIARYI